MEDLVDLRTKIHSMTNAVLEAHSRADGKDKSEIVREILHAWALKERDKANLVQQLVAREGGIRDCPGSPRAAQGSGRESQGIAGSGRE